MFKNKNSYYRCASGDIGIILLKKLISKKAKLICCIRKENKKFSEFYRKNKKNILLVLKFDFNK